MNSTFATQSNQLTPLQQAAFDEFLRKNKAQSFAFELLEAGAPMPIQGPGNIIQPEMRFSSRHIGGEVEFPSPEGVQVRVMYSKRSERIKQNGVDATVAIPESIWFEASRAGKIEVPRNQTAWLVRMLFSNECINSINPAFVEPITGCVYRLIQPEVTAAEMAAARSLRIKVQGMIDGNTEEENKLVARRLETTKRLQFNYALGADALRLALFDAADADAAAVFAATNDGALKGRALVEQAEKAGLIRFQHETRDWLLAATGQPIQHIPSGEPVEGLAAWLLDTQGAATQASLKRMLTDGKPPKKNDEPIPPGYKKGRFGRLVPIDDNGADTGADTDNNDSNNGTD